MLTLSDSINLKKTKVGKKTISEILLITASILILLVPDVLINDDQNVLNFGFSIFSKICLFIFLSSIILRLTRSYFWTYLIIGIPYLISSLIESINIIILNHHITADNIVSLLNASMGEIKEFSNGFYLYFSIPVVLIITYVFILRKYRSISYNAKNQKRIIPLGLIAIVISLSISFFKVLHSGKIYSGKNLTKYTLRTYYLEQHPFNLLNESYVFAKNKLRAYRYKAQHDNFNFGILNPTDTIKPKIVVFIIGERMRYSNWSINGYARETSPNSIPLIITQATPQTPNVAYAQKSIVSLFKEAGYETSWISSQYLFDIIDERKVPDHLYELYKKKHTDMDILPLFDSVINRKSTKNKLIVINMIGGHGGIPERFDQFKPDNDLGNYPVTMGNAPLFINTYDNLILLQDYVISELIKRTEKQNVSSVLMFTADHGCNLFDNGKALFGYGSANPTEKETHIPMFISMSNKFIENNHNKYKNLSDHKNLLTTNNNLFYTLADLANIKYKSFIKKQSISDSSFVEPSSRFVYVDGTIFEFKK